MLSEAIDLVQEKSMDNIRLASEFYANERAKLEHQYESELVSVYLQEFDSIKSSINRNVRKTRPSLPQQTYYHDQIDLTG